MARRKSETLLTPDAVPTALDKLNVKQRLFIQYMTDPTSDSFGNQGESYRRAYGDVANPYSSGSRLYNNVHTAVALREEIEKQGLGRVVRVDKVKDVILGKATTETVQVTERDPETGTVTTRTVAGVRPQDRLRALALLDKWDGSDAARRAEADAKGTLLRGLAKRLLADMAPPTDRRRTRKARQGATQQPKDVESRAEPSEAAATEHGGA